jgi:septum formation topological specificity factor MinE
MKDELIVVISRYVEIDADEVEVSFTQSKRESRLVANIPVRGPADKPKSGRVATRVRAGGNG